MPLAGKYHRKNSFQICERYIKSNIEINRTRKKHRRRVYDFESEGQFKNCPYILDISLYRKQSTKWSFTIPTACIKA